MPTAPDDPLRKVTLNLYASDCEFLERTYGRGWTERVRQHIHAEVEKRSYINKYGSTPRRTLADIGSGYEHKDPMWPDDLGEQDDDE